MEEELLLNYPLDFPFQNEDEISKCVEMPVATKACNLEKHYVSKLLSGINFDSVQNLFLCAKQLTDLPEDFGFHFVNLTRLDLSENELTTVPHSLKFILNLKKLFLNTNRIHYLPLTITEITSLTELNLSNNSMTSLPESIANLCSLEVLNLVDNKLSGLPLACQKLNNLKVLDLTGNRLTRVPECIVTGMTDLQSLHLSRNLNIDLSEKPSCKKLLALYVRKAGRNVKFPTWILTGHASHLEILDFDCTLFDPFEFPDQCSKLNIQILSIQNCCIYKLQLEKMLSLTKELAVLRVANRKRFIKNNGYWHMPMEPLEFPEKMIEMDLCSTRLSFVPEKVELLVNIVKLDLGHNALRWLPDEICKLKKLKMLYVDHNFLTTLPNDLGGLTSLTELRANRNKIASLPDSTIHLENLAILDLYENSFTCVPETVQSMNNLKGFDIDLNPVFISDLQIKETKYETMRKTLHQRYQGCEVHRRTGPRYDIDLDDSSETSSENWSPDENEHDAEIIGNKVNDTCPENWSISDDSADDYDPTYDDGKASRKQSIHFHYAPLYSTLFCPANLHPLSIKQQIVRLKERGLFQEYEGAEVDGQFEDA